MAYSDGISSCYEQSKFSHRFQREGIPLGWIRRYLSFLFTILFTALFACEVGAQQSAPAQHLEVGVQYSYLLLRPPIQLSGVDVILDGQRHLAGATYHATGLLNL